MNHSYLSKPSDAGRSAQWQPKRVSGAGQSVRWQAAAVAGVRVARASEGLAAAGAGARVSKGPAAASAGDGHIPRHHGLGGQQTERVERVTARALSGFMTRRYDGEQGKESGTRAELS